MKIHAFIAVVAFALSAVAVPHAAFAQDAAVVNSDTVHVKLDNAHVRVLESILKPGQKEQPHSHPPSVIYILSGGRLRNHLAGGKSVNVELRTGETIYRDPLTHWAENTGTTTIRLILVELKEPK